jgi:hypothetical protein
MKRRWVKGLTMGKHRFRNETYYFVDDRFGGRRPASDLEVELWKKSVGPIPFGPDDCITSMGSSLVRPANKGGAP